MRKLMIGAVALCLGGCSALNGGSVSVNPSDVAAGVECLGEVQSLVKLAKAHKADLNACVDLAKSIEKQAK